MNSEEQLIFFWTCIFPFLMSVVFSVSSRTIRIILIQYGLEENAANSDAELDRISRDFVEMHPNSGSRSLAGFLQSIRSTLGRVDPRGVQMRFGCVLHRQTYNVCMPNSLWHINGYHKLIKQKIVIHGEIDGYSRFPVYLHASFNNRSETV